MVNKLLILDYGVERKVICEFATSEEVEEIVSKLVLDAEKVNSFVAKI
jgi:hypothetical protein